MKELSSKETCKVSGAWNIGDPTGHCKKTCQYQPDNKGNGPDFSYFRCEYYTATGPVWYQASEAEALEIDPNWTHSAFISGGEEFYSCPEYMRQDGRDTSFKRK